MRLLPSLSPEEDDWTLPLLREQPFEAKCAVVGVCTFGEDRRLTDLKLYPCSQSKDIPMLADESTGKKIIEYLGKLSSPYGTEIKFEEGVEQVKIG